ncbi:MAG: histidine kinase [Deltaproteobacteria bacterium]|nr:histidine kinase [Deltaproteobacteria bacterium]
MNLKIEIKGKHILRNFLYTLLFNTIIAIFLTAIKFGDGFIVNLIFSQCIGISIFSIIHAALYIFRASGLIIRVVITIVGMIAGAIAGIAIGAAVNGIHPLFFIGEGFELFIQVMLIGVLFGAIISYFFVSRERILTGNAIILEERANRLAIEKKAVEAELKNLQSQIEPHFLINTLSTGISLIDMEPHKARMTIEEMVSLLRSSLSISRDKTITIGEEMKLVKSYLNIMKVRMENRLSFKTEICDGLSDYQIPPLLIQPLVENAIKHGLEPKIEGGEVKIRIAKNNGRVKITVSDTGIGFDYKNPSCGVGLDTIRKRLQLLYEEKANLILEENQPCGINAVIEIPYDGEY